MILRSKALRLVSVPSKRRVQEAAGHGGLRADQKNRFDKMLVNAVLNWQTRSAYGENEPPFQESRHGSSGGVRTRFEQPNVVGTLEGRRVGNRPMVH